MNDWGPGWQPDVDVEADTEGTAKWKCPTGFDFCEVDFDFHLPLLAANETHACELVMANAVNNIAAGEGEETLPFIGVHGIELRY